MIRCVVMPGCISGPAGPGKTPGKMLRWKTQEIRCLLAVKFQHHSARIGRRRGGFDGYGKDDDAEENQRDKEINQDHLHRRYSGLFSIADSTRMAVGFGA